MSKEEAKAKEDITAIGDVKKDGGSEASGHESAKDGSPGGGGAVANDNDGDAPETGKEPEHIPNSKLRVRDADADDDTYVYRDFAAIPAPATGGVVGAPLHPQSLQAQKLPAKLASMLADHGRLYEQRIASDSPNRFVRVVYSVALSFRALSSTREKS